MFIFNVMSLKQLAETSCPLGKGQKRKASQLNKAITIGSSPILYTQPAVNAGKSSLLSIVFETVHLFSIAPFAKENYSPCLSPLI